MTDQRDLAKEVERIAAGHRSTVIQGWGGEDLETLLSFIASQSRELEELRKVEETLETCRHQRDGYERELAALRRPVVQSESVERIKHRVRYAGWSPVLAMPGESTPWTAIKDDFESLLSALDQAQRELSAVRAAANKQGDGDLAELARLRAEIARLSSPPEERGEIAERQANRKHVAASGEITSILRRELMDEIDTLLGDSAAWRNAHALVTLERDEARTSLSHLRANYDALYPVAIKDRERIEQLESERDEARGKVERLGAALRDISQRMRHESKKTDQCYTCYTDLAALVADELDYALAAADGQQEETCEECGRGIPGDHHRAWVCNERTAATGDGVEGE